MKQEHRTSFFNGPHSRQTLERRCAPESCWLWSGCSKWGLMGAVADTCLTVRLVIHPLSDMYVCCMYGLVYWSQKIIMNGHWESPVSTSVSRYLSGCSVIDPGCFILCMSAGYTLLALCQSVWTASVHLSMCLRHACRREKDAIFVHSFVEAFCFFSLSIICLLRLPALCFGHMHGN